MSLNIIHVDCDPSYAKNKDLPRDSYLVTYVDEGNTKHDIVKCGAKVHIFDHYYDKYGEVKCIQWTEGTVNPKLWNYQAPDSSSKKKKR